MSRETSSGIQSALQSALNNWPGQLLYLRWTALDVPLARTSSVSSVLSSKELKCIGPNLAGVFGDVREAFERGRIDDLVNSVVLQSLRTLLAQILIFLFNI